MVSTWLDIANAYGSMAHLLLQVALQRSHVPEDVTFARFTIGHPYLVPEIGLLLERFDKFRPPWDCFSFARITDGTKSFP